MLKKILLKGCNPDLETLDGKRFIRAIIEAKNEDSLKLFLSDLFTPREIKLILKRINCIFWISLGTPYDRIQEITGISTKTISRLMKKTVNKKDGLSETMKDIFYKERRVDKKV